MRRGVHSAPAHAAAYSAAAFFCPGVYAQYSARGTAADADCGGNGRGRVKVGASLCQESRQKQNNGITKSVQRTV